MRNQSSEIFVNLFCGFMNRFATHPDEQVRQAISGLIGSENLERVTTASDGITEICEIFGEKLKTIGPYVRRFMMRDENNTRDNALFFCGRHERGLEKIKEAMWKVDPVSGATFSEYGARKSETAPSLLGFQERQTSPLRRSLVERFAGQAVTVSKLKEWVIEALRSTPAAVRFVSFEPLIGPISNANLRGVHWAIVGGESGPRARD